MGGQACVVFAFHFYNNIKEPGAALTRPSGLISLVSLSPQILTIKVGPLSSLIISRYLKSNYMKVGRLKLYSVPGSWDGEQTAGTKWEAGLTPAPATSPPAPPPECPSSSQPENRKISEEDEEERDSLHLNRKSRTDTLAT